MPARASSADPDVRETRPLRRADTIVGDFKGHPFRIGFHLNLCVAGSGVFYAVMERFLSDAVEGLLRLQGSVRFVTETDFNFDLVQSLERCGLLLKRCDHLLALISPRTVSSCSRL